MYKTFFFLMLRWLPSPALQLCPKNPALLITREKEKQSNDKPTKHTLHYYLIVMIANTTPALDE